MTFVIEVPKTMTTKQFGDVLFRTVLHTAMAGYVACDMAAAMDEDDERDSAQEAK